MAGSSDRSGLGRSARTLSRPSIRRWRPLQRALALLAAGLLVAACYTGPAASHFVEVADQLSIPADWQLIESVSHGPDQPDGCDPLIGLFCPAEIRTYIVDRDATDVYSEASDMVRSAGFELSPDQVPCTSTTRPDVACELWARRDGDALVVFVYRTLADAGLNDPSSGKTAVKVTVYGGSDTQASGG